MNKLTVTNYDNFKNADFFKKQYLQAQDMLKEVNDFFNSFCMSKLLTAKDLLKISPALVSSYEAWINYFVFPAYTYNEQVECLLKGKKFDASSYYDYKHISNEEAKEKCKEYAKYLIQDFNKIVEENSNYDCYFVLDKYNILYDFIPVKCKDTISIDFLGDNITISGYFYDYSEHGITHGDCGYRICKITRKIIINGSTNNVESIETSIQQVEEGQVPHKTYWDRYTSYAMTNRDSDCVSTKQWYGIRKLIKDRYNHHKDLARHSSYWYGNEEIKQLLLKSFSNDYKKFFGRDITIEYIENCCNSWY